MTAPKPAPPRRGHRPRNGAGNIVVPAKRLTENDGIHVVDFHSRIAHIEAQCGVVFSGRRAMNRNGELIGVYGRKQDWTDVKGAKA